jgi:hypothetical protein
MSPRSALASGALLFLVLGAGSARAQGPEQLPPGHPATPPGDEAEGTRSGAAPGMFEPPPDTEDEDAALPAGSIFIELRDADNRVLPREAITVGVIHQSVAKGESREHRLVIADEKGMARLAGLETGSGVAYRVTVPKDGATFAALPFQLSMDKGMHVVLHVYPVTHDLNRALIVMQTIVFSELKDDRVQVQEAVSVYNLGKVTWVPDGLLLKLPETFTALTSQQQMGDQGVDSVDKQGARLRGTFAPGRHDVEFRWQLPYDGEKEVVLDVGLPPHVAMMRVMALASQDMKLVVEDLPEAKPRTDAQGQRLLVTERQLRREDNPLSSLHISLRDLPAPGPGRIVATCIAALGILFGVGLAFVNGRASSPSTSPKTARVLLLAELEDLERARLSGSIGPKTYARARRELIDAIARTLVTRPERAESR